MELFVHHRVIEQTAREDDILLALGQRAFGVDLNILCLVDDGDAVACRDLITDILDIEIIAEVDVVVIIFIREFQRKDTRVDQVRSVDTRKALDQYRLNAEIQRRGGAKRRRVAAAS